MPLVYQSLAEISKNNAENVKVENTLNEDEKIAFKAEHCELVVGEGSCSTSVEELQESTAEDAGKNGEASKSKTTTSSEQRTSSSTSGSKTTTTGDLYLTTSKIIFQTGDQRILLDYPSVMLHAISRDPQAFPKPCLYCQVRSDGGGNKSMIGVESANNDPKNHTTDSSPTEDQEMVDDDDDDEADQFQTTEIRFVVPEADVQVLFDAMSEMVLLHPDPDCDSEDEDNIMGGAGGGFGDPDAGWVFSDDFNPNNLLGVADYDALEDAEEEEEEEEDFSEDEMAVE
ncbi:unnamed protein product [Amoebophrya sp. A120]|nr:unnamed protein product [Amoebophrya sp. A120]|eukprot:GSA120T00000572001.1